MRNAAKLEAAILLIILLYPIFILLKISSIQAAAIIVIGEENCHAIFDNNSLCNSLATTAIIQFNKIRLI